MGGYKVGKGMGKNETGRTEPVIPDTSSRAKAAEGLGKENRKAPKPEPEVTKFGVKRPNFDNDELEFLQLLKRQKTNKV